MGSWFFLAALLPGSTFTWATKQHWMFRQEKTQNCEPKMVSAVCLGGHWKRVDVMVPGVFESKRRVALGNRLAQTTGASMQIYTIRQTDFLIQFCLLGGISRQTAFHKEIEQPANPARLKR